MKREGPKPLALHIGLNSAFIGNAEDAAQKLTEMIRGIQLYQKSDYQRDGSGYDVVWKCGQTELRRIIAVKSQYTGGGVEMHAPRACVLVPSLINGSEILDLSRERSLAQYMISQGFDTYIVDWGDLCRDEPGLTLLDLVVNRLAPALSFLDDVREGSGFVDVLGYCMGGALAYCGALSCQVRLGSLTLLATPWNFHAGSGDMLNRVRFWSGNALASVESQGFLSADYLQSLFATLDPTLTQIKFSRFADLDPDSQSARLFVAVEDWLNDGRDLPQSIARECILDWFLDNKLSDGHWGIDEMRLKQTHKLDIPVLVVASRKDRLVEYESAVDIMRTVPHADLIEPQCGHIGMIAGEASIDQVWAPIAQWIKAQM